MTAAERPDPRPGPGVGDEVLVARAFLSRVAEPANVPLWGFVQQVGPVAAVAAIRCGDAPDGVNSACASRVASMDPLADLDVAERHGIRLVVPESADWPHFGLAPLERTGGRRFAAYEAGDRRQSERGELVPPLALWVSGPGDLATVGMRSVGVVGSRASTPYGNRVAADLGSDLATAGFVIVSGGALGIDEAAHRGALSADGATVLVSAGGLDGVYPPSNSRLFDRVRSTGLLVSESPPGSEPRRHRFLSRNRIIASLSTGTVVVEAAKRSGAMNTARHALDLGRTLMVVPGPISSAMSVGCHDLLLEHWDTANLVTTHQAVIDLIGSSSDLSSADADADADSATGASRAGRAGSDLRAELDALDPAARQVYDSFPARLAVSVDQLVIGSGLAVTPVLRALTALELAGLVERHGAGVRRCGRPDRVSSRSRRVLTPGGGTGGP